MAGDPRAAVSFKDHFSGHAGEYARYRPGYPEPLFAALAAQAPDAELAWDVATGTGQAAVLLSAHFRHVVASDASGAQIAHAAARSNIDYRIEPAERSSLAAGSASLVCAAQAAHWFDLPAFYAEVRRVAKPSAVVALVGYGLGHVVQANPERTNALARALDHFYSERVGEYWPPERRHVENGYRDLSFPFERIAFPEFEMALELSLAEFIGYVRTWSAVKRYLQVRGADPVLEFADEITPLWGDPEQRYPFRMPLILVAGRVNAAEVR
jgi:SAM-dependent methyltransferase